MFRQSKKRKYESIELEEIVDLNVDTSHYSPLKKRKYESIELEEIVDLNANISLYPPLKNYHRGKSYQLTIGDLHANALKLLYFLVREKVMSMDEKDYLVFVNIYCKDIKKIREKDLKRLNILLENASCASFPKTALIRLIGDELADRGQCDFYVLKILEKLHRENVSYEIIFSNHGFEFLQVYAAGIRGHYSYLEKCDSASSITGMRKLISKGLVSLKEFNDLVQTVYLPYMKVFSCSISSVVTFYSHAVIGLNTVKALAESYPMQVEYKDNSPEALAETLSDINEIFSHIVKKSCLMKTFGDDLCSSDDVNKISFSNPLRRSIWSRGRQMKDFPVTHLGNANLFFAHGHDGDGKVGRRFQKNVFNLDNNLGKGGGINQGKYKILYARQHPK